MRTQVKELPLEIGKQLNIFYTYSTFIFYINKRVLRGSRSHTFNIGENNSNLVIYK